MYPKKYAHGFCFAVLCCGYTLTDFPIYIRLTSLALWQSNDCPSASKATLMNMDKYFMRINYERLHNHNKAKHNKTVCIFIGIYCMRHQTRPPWVQIMVCRRFGAIIWTSAGLLLTRSFTTHLNDIWVKYNHFHCCLQIDSHFVAGIINNFEIAALCVTITYYRCVLFLKRHGLRCQFGIIMKPLSGFLTKR